jgi:predicted nucleic acid-binding protein
MTAPSNPYFLDSNIWIYALTNQDPNKQASAANLINAPNVVVSTQVINEVCVNLIKKAAFSEDQIKQLLTAFYQGCQVIEFDLNLLTLASDLRTQYSVSFWDSLILSSAIVAGTRTLYTEDLQDGLIINQQIQIINPFLLSKQ